LAAWEKRWESCGAGCARRRYEGPVWVLSVAFDLDLTLLILLDQGPQFLINLNSFHRLGPQFDYAKNWTATSDQFQTLSHGFKDLLPSQIVPRLADQSKYVACESTLYRLLRSAGQMTHRRAERIPHLRNRAASAGQVSAAGRG
jgi:hypothetical protein